MKLKFIAASTTATTTTTTTTTTTSTSSVSITQTTRLDAMLFNSQEPATTEKDDQRLEDLLFKEEETMIPENTSRSSVSSSARLPKTSKDIGINNNDIETDSSPAMTTTTIEESEITTETLMKVSTTLQAVDYFEYVETEREEDAKYLEKAIGKFKKSLDFLREYGIMVENYEELVKRHLNPPSYMIYVLRFACQALNQLQV